LGVSNLGKTTTIRLAYEDMKNQYPIRKDGRFTRNGQEINGAILEIDGVLVGFAGKGDRPDILEDYLLPLIEAGCVVIVCATHTRGGTVETVERLAAQAEPPFKFVRIEKACKQVDHADGNRKKADEIITEIRRAVAVVSAQLVGA
jgi:hypothetical protein